MLCTRTSIVPDPIALPSRLSRSGLRKMPGKIVRTSIRMTARLARCRTVGLISSTPELEREANVPRRRGRDREPVGAPADRNAAVVLEAITPSGDERPSESQVDLPVAVDVRELTTPNEERGLRPEPRLPLLDAAQRQEPRRESFGEIHQTVRPSISGTTMRLPATSTEPRTSLRTGTSVSTPSSLTTDQTSFAAVWITSRTVPSARPRSVSTTHPSIW